MAERVIVNAPYPHVVSVRAQNEFYDQNHILTVVPRIEVDFSKVNGCVFDSSKSVYADDDEAIKMIKDFFVKRAAAMPATYQIIDPKEYDKAVGDFETPDETKAKVKAGARSSKDLVGQVDDKG